MFERFTDRARKVMALANQEALRFNHEYIGTEHILLGLVKEGSGVGANVLKNLDVDLLKVRGEVEKLVRSGPDMVTIGKRPQTPRAKKVIEYAIEEARNLNHTYVGTEHLLLGLLREQDGVAAQVLMNLGLKLEEVREEVLRLLGGGRQAIEEAPSPLLAPSVHAPFSHLSCAVFSHLVAAVESEIQRLEDARLQAVKNADYERLADLRDRVDGLRTELAGVNETIAEVVKRLEEILKKAQA